MIDRTQERYRQCVNYLVKALQRNPLDESAQIVSGRSKLLGQNAMRPAAMAATREDHRQKRQDIFDEVERLRRDFWAAPLVELRSALAKLDASDFPDLRAAVDRLKLVALHRGEFPDLVRHRHFDSSFFAVFKEVLVSSPREVAVTRERALASFAKRGRRGKKMIQLIKRTLPAIYDLEAGWLNSLSKQKRAVAASTKQATASPFVGDREGFNIPWWAIILGIVLLRVLFLGLGK